MKYNPDIHHRRSIRLQGYGYSQRGAYFVTLCTSERLPLFGEIQSGKMLLNDAGGMIHRQWHALLPRFHHIELHEFVVMPNHVHGILVINRRGDPCDRPKSCIRPDVSNKNGMEDRKTGDHKTGDHKDRPYGTLPGSVGRIVQAFKSITTHEYADGVKQHGWAPFPGKLWQRNYYEHIIRNEESYLRNL